MRVHNHPAAYGFLAGAIVLILGLLVNAGCVHATMVTLPSSGAPDAALAGGYDAAVGITAHCVQANGRQIGWYGSGVIVDATHLITAGHVAELESPGDVCSFVAEDSAGRTHLVFPKVVLKSTEIDLASMELVSFTERFHSQPVRFGSVPVLGDIVCAFTAFPRREHRCGQVMKPKAHPGDIRINMVVEPGNSGSALYNMRHELVGIVVHTYPNRDNGQFVTGGASSLQRYVAELFK